MLIELDRIQLDKAATAAGTKVRDIPFDKARAAPRYSALLRDYGVDPAAPAAAAERVLGSRLRHALLAALDDWRRVTPDAAERRRLEVVLQAAEPTEDPFRRRWLAAVRRGDGAALAQLAGEPAAQELPVLAIPNLARDLDDARQVGAAERLLRAWQARYPGSFWLNHELGWLLLRDPQVPTQPRTWEALRYLTARWPCGVIALPSTST